MRERVGLARSDHEDDDGLPAELAERAHAPIAVDHDALAVLAHDDEHGVLLPDGADRRHQAGLGRRVACTQVGEVEREQAQLHLRRPDRQRRVPHAPRQTTRRHAEAISARDTSPRPRPRNAHFAAQFGSFVAPSRRVTGRPSRAGPAQIVHDLLHESSHFAPELGA